MTRAFALLVIAAASAVGQVCPTQLSIETGDIYGRLGYTLSATGSTHFRAHYAVEPTDPAAFAWRTGEPSGEAPIVVRAQSLHGFAPATTYYLFPSVRQPGGATWSTLEDCEIHLCPDGDGPQTGRDYSCAEVGSSGVYSPVMTTGAPEDPTPIAPTVTHGVPGDLTITGDDFAATCETLDSQFAACVSAASADGLVHRVMLEPGVCEAATRWNFSSGPTQGRCQLRSSADAALLPPPGGAINPSHKLAGGIATLTPSPRYTYWMSWATNAVAFRFGSRLTIGPGIEIATPSVASAIAAARRVAITEVATDTGQMATETTPPNGGMVQIYVGELGQRKYSQGSCRTAAPTTDTQFRCYEGAAANYPTGGAGSETGYWTDAAAWPLDSCDSAGDCSTSSKPHPYTNRYAFSVSAVSGTSVTTETNQIQEGASVRLTGLASGCTDGIYRVSARTSTTLTLTASAGTCGAGGTARQLHGVLVGGVSAEADGGYLAEFDGENHVRLAEPAPPSGFTGGWVSVDPSAKAQSFVALGAATDTIFDRVLVKIDLPWRVSRAFQLSTAEQVAAWGVHADGPRPWFMVPDGWRADATASVTPFQYVPTGFQVNQTVGFAMRNSAFWDGGWPVFRDGGNTPATDISLRGFRSGFPAWRPGGFNRIHVGHRQPNAESKSSVRWEVCGHETIGGHVKTSPNPGAPFFSQIGVQGVVGGIARMEDVRVCDFRVVDSAEGIGLSVLGNFGQLPRWPVHRWEVENALILTDYWSKFGRPGGQGMELPLGWNTNASGSVFGVGEGSHMRFSRITGRGRGNRPTFLTMPANAQRAGDWQLTTSIVVASRGVGVVTEAFAATLSGAAGPGNPTVSGLTNWPLIRDAFRRVAAASEHDPLFALEATVVACTTDTEPSTWLTSTNSYKSTLEAALDCTSDGCPTNYALTFPGADGQSCQERQDIVFEPGSWRPKAEFAGQGADIRAIEDALSEFSATLTPIAGGVRVTFDRSPPGATCRAQGTATSAGLLPDRSTVSAWASAVEGVVDLTGYAAGSDVWVIGTCGFSERWSRARAE